MKKIVNHFSLAGHFLISVPSIKDQRFSKSVIFMCRHDESGAMGLLINKVLDEIRLSHVLEQFKIPKSAHMFDLPVHFGGPVAMGRGFSLHSTDLMLKDSVEVIPNVALTTSTDILKAFSLRQKPRKRFLALGYSGWSPGKLEAEIKDNAWLQMKADAQLIFDASPDNLWQAVFQRMGINPAKLTQEAGHA